MKFSANMVKPGCTHTNYRVLHLSFVVTMLSKYPLFTKHKFHFNSRSFFSYSLGMRIAVYVTSKIPIFVVCNFCITNNCTLSARLF